MFSLRALSDRSVTDVVVPVENGTPAMPAILFGSISTVADTSELQRKAFNDAFAAHGLDWSWDRDDYRALLTSSGGRSRVAEYADSRSETVDADAVHQTKSALFQEELAGADLEPRAGVVDAIRSAKSLGWKVGLVTTTSGANVAALLEAVGPHLSADDFDVVVDVTDVEQPKPDQEAYTFALHALGETADRCVAIEDNVGGVQAAVAAGLTCVAFPNENTADHDFADAERRIDRVDVADLKNLNAA
ncbi:HAD family hydrolase [soil metagenome]